MLHLRLGGFKTVLQSQAQQVRCSWWQFVAFTQVVEGHVGRMAAEVMWAHLAKDIGCVLPQRFISVRCKAKYSLCHTPHVALSVSVTAQVGNAILPGEVML